MRPWEHFLKLDIFKTFDFIKTDFEGKSLNFNRNQLFINNTENKAEELFTMILIV